MDSSDAPDSTGQASRLLPGPQDMCRRDDMEHGIDTAGVASVPISASVILRSMYTFQSCLMIAQCWGDALGADNH